MKNIVEIVDLSKSFKNQIVLNKISKSFEQGKIHGIMGFNGSGKTVMFKCICGFLQYDTGHIFVQGKEIGKERQIHNLNTVYEVSV